MAKKRGPRPVPRRVEHHCTTAGNGNRWLPTRNNPAAASAPSTRWPSCGSAPRRRSRVQKAKMKTPAHTSAPAARRKGPTPASRPRECSASAFASLLLLHSRGLLAGVGPLRLAAGALVWAGVFIFAFWTLLRRRGADPQLGHLVLGALAAAGLFLVGNHLLPLPAVVQWCSTRLGTGLGPLFFAMGTVYAAIPLLLFATSASRRWHVRPRRVLIAGGFFFMLVAPAIFLQCAYFTAGALFAWLLGAVAGSLAASAAGYWLGTRASA